MARLQVLAGALDAKQRESDLPSTPFLLRVPEQPPPGAINDLKVLLALRRGRNTVVVHVVDEVAGETFRRLLELER